jgi:hypothetical protein
MALGFALIGVIWVAIVWSVTTLAAHRCPAGTFLSGSPRLAGIFVMVAPGFAAIGPGFLAANWLTGLTSAGRTFFDGDADFRSTAQFRRDQTKLIAFSAALLAAGAVISALASVSQFCLAPQGIYDRAALWSDMQFYPWSSVSKITTGCGRGGKSSWYYHYALALPEGRSLDIMDGTAPVWRTKAQLLAALHPYAFAFDSTGVDPRCAVALLTVRP